MTIYTASKTKHAALWRQLRDAGAPIISTWIDEAGEGESADLHDLWERCISESKACDALIVYREPEDVLKGAWVEIGAALAVGKPVYAVGLNGFTISKYRGIQHFPSLAAAFKAAGWPDRVGREKQP
jgi:nucleoside 2-deoxyribosyltransferase